LWSPGNEAKVLGGYFSEESTKLISINKDHFDTNGNLKPEHKDKYKPLRQATIDTTVEIYAHGTSFTPGLLWSRPFSSASQSGFFQSSSLKTSFSAKLIAELIKRIKDPAVSVKRDELKHINKLPEKHLKVSLLACQGEHFANHLLCDLLKSDDKNDKAVLCIITTGKKSKLLVIHEQGYKSFKEDVENLRRARNTRNALILADAACIIAIILAETGVVESPDLVKAAIIGLGICIGIQLALSLYVHLSTPDDASSNANATSTRTDEVVLLPDFKKPNNKENKPVFPNQTLSKEEFIKACEKEKIAAVNLDPKNIETPCELYKDSLGEETMERDFDPRHIKMQYGSFYGET
jgi:hypothetical protein